MPIEFNIKKFAYPISIIKLRRFLEKSQWFSEEELKEYQNKRLREIIEHCYENVPYYRNLFDELRLKPDDFRDTNDLKKLPLLTKDIIKKNLPLLTAKNIKKFKPSLYQTSGTTREPLKFYLDKSSHILEFCYYWRYWSWAGYRLGDPFVQFSPQYFLKRNNKDFSSYSPLTKYLILNSNLLCFDNLDRFVALLKRYKPLFIKGYPSTISTLALMLEKAGSADIHFKAVFTIAEKLLGHHKQSIEKFFNCPILDSYGHMESAVAVSQCPHGSYHINSEYGIFSIDEKEEIGHPKGNRVGEIIGTSLHNFAMPFLRYRVGDIAVLDPTHKRCECGRGLPVVKEITGRTDDIIITPDERFITGAHGPFNFVDGILWYQFVQESKERVVVKITRSEEVSAQLIEERLRHNLQKMLGERVNITFEFVPLSHSSESPKHKPIISYLDIKDFI
jgi:phenylacetate-CoA ligase